MTKKKERPLAIFPCAGFGTRYSMRKNQSKEMLINRYGERLIEIGLYDAVMAGYDCLVITRKEKTDLISYSLDHGFKVLIVEPGKEWMNTVLLSESLWRENNVLLLPDTTCHFRTAKLVQMRQQLELGEPISIGLHGPVKDTEKWCVLDGSYLLEKHRALSTPGPMYAFGLIGWKKDYGGNLFSSLSNYSYAPVPRRSVVKLEGFKDLTRKKTKEWTYAPYTGKARK